jgi:Ca-activated chloride channel homolog
MTIPPLRPWIRPLFSRFALAFSLGLCLSWLLACSKIPVLGGLGNVDSPESARQALQSKILPQINVETATVDDAVAARYSVDRLPDPLPDLNDFPLHGSQPGQGGSLYLEIFSSSEKSNIDRQNERWLVEVAEAFNQQRLKADSGEVIQVGVRSIPAGTAARFLAEKAAQPAAYSPSSNLWVEMIRSQGVQVETVAEKLVPNQAGWVIPATTYQQLSQQGAVTFDSLLDAIGSGQVTIGYPNPYTSSTALNLMYTLFWRAAGHQTDGGALTVADLESPQVNSVFQQFQQQVLATTTTTLDLQELFLRDQTKLQAFPLEYQNYLALKQVPGFEQTEFVPFGVPHNNPLVGFDWNTPAQKSALQRFAAFALSPPMQTLAQQQGFGPDVPSPAGKVPPTPSGEVLLAAQRQWKLQKDGDRTAYMMVVIDASGSMAGDRIQSVKEGLRSASQQINSGNFVGLVTFSDKTVRRVPLAPFDTLQQQRWLAALDAVEADGGTAMYDGVAVALADLLDQQAQDPKGRFYLLLLSDGETNQGLRLNQIEQILIHSQVRFYPIAYGEVNQAELQALAQLRESTVKSGDPKTVQQLFKDLFQVNL